MKYLPAETLIAASRGDKLVLTNHRIQMTDSNFWGQSFTISIFLEDISSMEVKHKSNTLLLMLGIICVLGGFIRNGFMDIVGSEYAMFAGFVLGGIFFAIWFFTRKHIISISSNGGSSLNFIAQYMSDEKIDDFLYNVSLSKQTRVNQLAKL